MRMEIWVRQDGRKRKKKYHEYEIECTGKLIDFMIDGKKVFIPPQ